MSGFIALFCCLSRFFNPLSKYERKQPKNRFGSMWEILVKGKPLQHIQSVLEQRGGGAGTQPSSFAVILPRLWPSIVPTSLSTQYLRKLNICFFYQTVMLRRLSRVDSVLCLGCVTSSCVQMRVDIVKGRGGGRMKHGRTPYVLVQQGWVQVTLDEINLGSGNFKNFILAWGESPS